MGVPHRAFGNVIAWQPNKKERFIQAIGTPDQWNSSGPLPEGTVVTDLIQASLQEAHVAAKLWEYFLLYVYHANAQDEPLTARIVEKFRRLFRGIPVSVSIADQALASAVEQAIKSSKSFCIES